MIALRLSLWLVLALGLSSAAHAQGTQCRTDPVGSKSSNCASEEFVTDSITAAPSAAKAWASITGSTGAAVASYNGTPTRSSAGVYTLTFTTAFASVDYACVTTAKSNSALLVTQITGQTASIASFQSSTPAGVLTDPTTIEIVCFGGQ